MPRRLRVDTLGYYHIYNRGVERRDIFLDNLDKEKFLKILCEVSRLYKLNIHSFCLMDNHYHLLLENQRENLSDAMRQVNSQYAIYFNKRHKRVGHLWQDRYKSWYVMDDNYLFILFKYIEQNPIKAGITNRIGMYKYASSYCFLRDIIPKFLQNSFVLREYNVEEIFKQLDTKLTKDEIKSLEKLKTKKFKKENDEVVEVTMKPLEEFFEQNQDRAKRDRAILKAFEEGYRKSQIAKEVGLSAARVGKIIKSLEFSPDPF